MFLTIFRKFKNRDFFQENFEKLKDQMIRTKNRPIMGGKGHSIIGRGARKIEEKTKKNLDFRASCVYC